jgi:hypothetical protein
MEAMPLKARQAALTFFTLRMAAETPEIAKQLGDEYGKPPEQRDPDKIDKLLADAIQNIGFTAAGGVGLKRGLTPTEPPAKVQVQWREVQSPSRDVKPQAPEAKPQAEQPVKSPPARRPYSDFQDHPSVGPGKNFTQSQKAKILAANQDRNNGALKDDKTGEPLVRAQKSQKGVTPPGNEAHIDHVDPRSKGGSNSFKNAEVRSRANNLRKSDKTDGDL